ncbi:hypothetical protein [Micromonospora luteifusca]
MASREGEATTSWIERDLARHRDGRASGLVRGGGGGHGQVAAQRRRELAG